MEKNDTPENLLPIREEIKQTESFKHFTDDCPSLMPCDCENECALLLPIDQITTKANEVEKEGFKNLLPIREEPELLPSDDSVKTKPNQIWPHEHDNLVEKLMSVIPLEDPEVAENVANAYIKIFNQYGKKGDQPAKPEHDKDEQIRILTELLNQASETISRLTNNEFPFKKFSLYHETLPTIATDNTSPILPNKPEPTRQLVLDELIETLTQLRDSYEIGTAWKTYNNAIREAQSLRKKEEDSIPKWVSIQDGFPEKPILVWAYDSQLRHAQAMVYTKGWDIEVDDEDENGDFNVKESTGQLFLKEGWYQECEQASGTYDYVWFKRNVTHWMPRLPHPNI